jgi:phospholipase/carboxylesterase
MSDSSLVHVVRPPAPGANAAGERPPLLILMHGVGSNERSMAQLAPTLDARFVVLSVRSPLVFGPDAFGWFHVTFTAQGPVIAAEEAQAGWTRVARFIDDALHSYGADPERVFLAGFSQGAIMALATLLTAPHKVAGAVAMSGRLLPEVLPHAAAPEALRGRRALIVHGTADEKLGIHFARGAREVLARFPLDLAYHELPMGHAITPESLVVVHAWLTAALDERAPAATFDTEGTAHA